MPMVRSPPVRGIIFSDSSGLGKARIGNIDDLIFGCLWCGITTGNQKKKAYEKEWSHRKFSYLPLERGAFLGSPLQSQVLC